MSEARPVVLIAGPTASGKSALALRLAEAAGGEIVNADAIQLYRDLHVLSARPSAEEEARAPHHLFAVADAADGWSVGRWLQQATAAIEEIFSRGRLPVVVGGTGLYFRALTSGLADMPASQSSSRAEAGALFDRLGEAAFRESLARVDPRAETRIAPGDRQRLTRAHEVHALSGKAMSDWQDATVPALAAGRWTGVVLEPSRKALYARCDARFEAMVEAGAVAEASRLAARRLDPDLPVMKATGLRELAVHLVGGLSLQDAVRLAQQETRRYAKRQSTWFRNQTPDWPRVTAADPDGQWREFTDLEPFRALTATG